MKSRSSSNLLSFQRSEGPKTKAVIALALRPDSEPWYLLEHALDWVQKLDARLDLCSVLPSVKVDLSGTDISPHRERPLRRKRLVVRKWLNRLMATVPVHSRGNISILEGEPGSVLIEYASSHTLLVLGRSQSRGGVSIFGRSVPVRLAQRCTIPVAIVGGRRFRPNMVAMLPLSQAPPQLEAVQWLAEYLPHSNLSTVCRASNTERPDDSVSANALVSLPAASDRRSEIWVRALTLHGLGRALARHAACMDADLVAVPASRRTGPLRWLFGSVVDGLIQDCHCSVLVVPRPAPYDPATT